MNLAIAGMRETSSAIKGEIMKQSGWLGLEIWRSILLAGKGYQYRDDCVFAGTIVKMFQLTGVNLAIQ